MLPAAISTITGSLLPPRVVISETSGATASGPAKPAAQASSNLSLNAISMIIPPKEEGGRRWPAPLSHLVGIEGRYLRGRLHLAHQIVVPLAFDLEVRGGAEVGGLDQIMRDIGVDAGLQELVHRRSRRAA